MKKTLIFPGDFYSAEAEKTKKNWFLFEYACELESFIRRDKSLSKKLKAKGINDKRLASFCILHSKLLGNELFKQDMTKPFLIKFGFDAIEKYLSSIGEKLIEQVLSKAAQACDSMLETCQECPSRCPFQPKDIATNFDIPAFWA